jgi:hypothetical protein
MWAALEVTGSRGKKEREIERNTGEQTSSRNKSGCIRVL